MDVRNLSIKLRHWGGVVVLLSLILGCSVHDFVPVWRYCGVTITDSEDNTAVIYEGCGTSVFNIDLDSTEAYSLSIVRTDDSAPIDGDGISFICDGVDILNNHSSGGISVAKDGNTYTFSGIPSTEKTVEIILMLDDIVIGTHIVNIRKDRYISDPVDPPAEPIEIELSFDAEADDPEFITILPSKSIKGLEIYYTLDGSEPSKNSDKYSTAVDLSAVPGSAVLKAKGFASSSESDVITLDYLIKGTKEDPVYLVYSEEGLREWARAVSIKPWSDCKLGKDIELSDSEDEFGNWNPVGVYQPFSGVFDGMHHTISNVKVNLTDDYGVGFFAFANEAKIFNLNITVNITGMSNVGAIIGNAYTTTITGCSASGNVKGVKYVGGIVGNFDSGSIISNCDSSCSVQADNTAGGIVGSYSSINPIISCSNSGDVIITSNTAGGIIGKTTTVNPGTQIIIENCTNEGVIKGNSIVGGIIGDVIESKIVNCINESSSNVVQGANSVGGIVGELGAFSTILGCKNNMEIIGEGDYAGGILGYSEGRSINIIACYNVGNIEAKSSGGIIGKIKNASNQLVSACYSTGFTDYGILGGYDAGWNDTKYSGCYFLNADNAGPSVNATKVKVWNDEISTNLNNAIPSDYPYKYVTNNLNSNEPYIIVANEQAGV